MFSVKFEVARRSMKEATETLKSCLLADLRSSPEVGFLMHNCLAVSMMAV